MSDSQKIWLDGQMLDESEAKISVFDHGLLYGDGIFESIRIIDGKPINLNPDMLFDSPFMSSEHGSGVVIIEKGHRKLKIDMGF